MSNYEQNEKIKNELFSLSGSKDNCLTECAELFKSIEYLENEIKNIREKIDFKKREIESNVIYMRSENAKKNYEKYLLEECKTKTSLETFLSYISSYLKYLN